jgi:hypothetical protein
MNIDKYPIITERGVFQSSGNGFEIFECEICFDIAYDPVLCPSCNKLFCKRDIANWVNKSKTCPQCSNSFETEQIRTNKYVQSLIDKLPSRCSHEGCDFEGSYSIVWQHMSKCSHELLKCPNIGCTETSIKRMNMSQHLIDCLYVPIQCCCGIDVTKINLAAHKNICPEQTVECQQGCGIFLKMSDLSAHLSKTCLAINVPCVHHEFGCEWTGKKCQLTMHLEQCSFTSLIPIIVKKDEEIKKKDVQIQELKNHITELELKQTSNALTTKKKSPQIRLCTCDSYGKYENHRFKCDGCSRGLEHALKYLHMCPDVDYCKTCAERSTIVSARGGERFVCSSCKTVTVNCALRLRNDIEICQKCKSTDKLIVIN